MDEKEENKQRALDYAWRILKKVVGLLVFLLMMYLLNALTPYINMDYYFEVVNFINMNLVLIVVTSIFFIVGEIFNMMIFPYNLPAPLFHGSASLFLVSLMLSSLKFLDKIMMSSMFQFLDAISFFVYLLVFMLVMFSGYVSIFYALVRRDYVPSEEKKLKAPASSKSWNDVGKEFRLMLYEFLHNMRSGMEKKKK